MKVKFWVMLWLMVAVDILFTWLAKLSIFIADYKCNIVLNISSKCVLIMFWSHTYSDPVLSFDNIFEWKIYRYTVFIHWHYQFIFSYILVIHLTTGQQLYRRQCTQKLLIGGYNILLITRIRLIGWNGGILT